MLKSLTANARKMFWLLAAYQVEHSKDADFRGDDVFRSVNYYILWIVSDF